MEAKADEKYQQWVQNIAEKEKQKQDLVFVCRQCGLKMPYIPRVNGKKQCPRCGDPLTLVNTVFVSIEESVKCAENLERLLESHIPSGRIGATLPSGT